MAFASTDALLGPPGADHNSCFRESKPGLDCFTYQWNFLAALAAVGARVFWIAFEASSLPLVQRGVVVSSSALDFAIITLEPIIPHRVP
ncbi:hypothetical protein Y1Q_0001891 [Alligator mississippiensis]|uniref:Uncharacterized protein n=1 Tax=Alligator mississippiensis TaxID=8496 RepID=A0A151PGE5_ALLMI|nr:hypothetical protein Y1Q_0001891 [Alligator mississippiensis]